ncbi:MAG TPA: nucleoside diphosphate kinase regulator [Vicinamibacterales bacterium]
MAERDIFITEEDHEKLTQLLTGVRQRRFKDLAHVEQLDNELDRARVVSADEIPPDVVTMNSQVALRDLGTGEDIVMTLVFPHEANMEERKVSVLAPLGTAVLGYRAGDVIEWEVPAGTRRLKVERVLFQPEASSSKAG